MTVRPTDPRWDSHSCPLITVPAVPSVLPYSSMTFSGPTRSIQASFTHGGHGAARCQIVSRELRSYRPGCSSRTRRIRSIIVGTNSAQSTRWASMASSAATGSNRSSTTRWHPMKAPHIE